MKVINTIMAAVLSVSLFGCTAQKTEDMSTSSDKTADCLLYTSPSPRDRLTSRMPSSA